MGIMSFGHLVCQAHSPGFGIPLSYLRFSLSELVNAHWYKKEMKWPRILLEGFMTSLIANGSFLKFMLAL